MNPLNNDSNKKVAIVHDDFIQKGGAEKLVECLLEIFPNADLFTSIISSEWRHKLLKQNPNLKIITSFIDKIPFKKKLYKPFSFLYPIAFWMFNFNDYDLVISSTARFAHGVQTKKETKHIAYVNSPARMIWEPFSYFNNYFAILVYPALVILRWWDKYAATKPDILIANSNTIYRRIKRYWNRESQVIYPFHDLNKNSLSRNNNGEYFILVSRLEKWKRIDLAIKACNDLKKKLVIIGEGKFKESLESIANPDYVKFMGRLSDEDLIKSYLESSALIMTQKEDFGITAVEAQSLGVPVIAYKAGGVLETVIENQTGLFFESQSVDSLKAVLEKFSSVEMKPELCIIQANKFTKDEFVRKITSLCQ